MKGKYLILALAIGAQCAQAMSPAIEAAKKGQLSNIINQLPNAISPAQANRLKTQGDALITELNKAGRPTNQLKRELADANRLYQSAQERATRARGTAAARDAAGRARERATLREFGEIEISGTQDERIRAVLTNVIQSLTNSAGSIGFLMNEEVFVDNLRNRAAFNSARIAQARHALKIDRDMMNNVSNIVDGYFDQFTDLINDLTTAEKNSLKEAGAFATYKGRAARSIDAFVAQLQAALLNNLVRFKTNSDSAAQQRNAKREIDTIVNRASRFYELTNSLGITNKDIAAFKAEYSRN